MIRSRTLLTLALSALAATLLAGCDLFGGGEGDAQKIIDETFGNETKVTSGVIDLTIEGSAEGTAGGSASATLSGPFQGDPDDPDAFPQLDLTASANASAVGQTFDFEGGLVVTDDNAFVEYGGDAYEVGAEVFSQLKGAVESASAQADTEGLAPTEAFRQSCEQAVEQAGGDDTSACDIDFNGWLTDLSEEGTEDIGGVATTHVHAGLDVEQMVQDLVAVGRAAGGASAVAIPSDDQIRQVTDAITDASFDLYSGEEDRILRGLDFGFGIDPTAIPGAESAGIESASLSFSLRLTGVNEEQTISAPSGAKPIEDLLGGFDLGDLGSLGALGGGLPFGPTGPSGGGGIPDTGSVPPADSDAAQEYLDCVAGNPDDIDQCQSLLTP